MKLVFLLNSTYPYYTGGRETWLYQVSARLCKTHDITIFSIASNKKYQHLDGKVPPIDPRITITSCFSFAVFTPVLKLLHSYLCLVNQWADIFFMKKQLFHFLRENRNEPVFVISMDTIFTGTLAMQAKQRFPNVRFINSVRGPHGEIDAKTYPLARKFFMKREIETLKAADQVWSNGEDTKADLSRRGIASVVVRNGVDCRRAPLPVPQELIPRETVFHLLTIGTLLDGKGYPQMIRAVAQVKKRWGYIVGLTIFGKGSQNRYRMLAQELGVSEQIVFAGFQSQTVEYASGFDGIVCLAGGGGQSMACLESLLSGTPVLAWDSPVYRQMIHHLETGYLVKEWDVSALADGIVWLIEHRDAARELGLAAKESVERFDWSHVVEMVEAQLKECV